MTDPWHHFNNSENIPSDTPPRDVLSALILLLQQRLNVAQFEIFTAINDPDASVDDLKATLKRIDESMKKIREHKDKAKRFIDASNRQ